jgi:hypothetical protein
VTASHQCGGKYQGQQQAQHVFWRLHPYFSYTRVQCCTHAS